VLFRSPQITGIALANQIVTIDFTALASDSASAFTLLKAPAVTGTYSNTPGTSITALSPGVFEATAPASDPVQFYRIKR
jgi:hypothetical protein